MRTIEVIRRGRNGQDGSSGLVVSLDLSANFTATAAYRAYMFRGTANLTLSFDPAASLAAGWHCFVDADGGDVVLDPSGSETINGVSTITVTDGQSAMVYTDGTSLFARYFYSEGTTSLLGFPTAVDRGLYSTGADVWAEFALTATGRALLGQGNKTSMRSYLEVAQDSADADFANDTAAAARRGLTKALIDAHGVVQFQRATLATAADYTTTIPADDTIPQNTEGSEVLTLGITPTSATNLLVIDSVIYASVSSATPFALALFKDSAADALQVESDFHPQNAVIQPIRLRHIMAAGGTSATTFKLRIGPTSAATLTVNGVSPATRRFGGRLISSLSIAEIKA